MVLVSRKSENLVDTDRFSQRFLPLDGLELPPAGTVHLWFLDLGKLGNPLMLGEGGTQTTVLNPRQEKTIRRFYLRLLLGAYLGVSGKDVSISRMVKGKPVLDPNIHQHRLDFSSAASNGCCLIGINTAGQIGVDLEQAGRKSGKPLALVRRYFSSQEYDRFGEMHEDEVDRAFLHTWACKEAVVKAAGHGIANQLCRFSVNTNPDEPAAMLDIEGDETRMWQLAMVRPARGFIGSVALKNDQLHIEGYSLNRRPAVQDA